MECAAREDRSTFDYDVTQDMERSEDVKMEMESFEYDEELPDTDGSNSVSLHRFLWMRRMLKIALRTV